MKNTKVKRFLALALLAVSLLVVAMPAMAANPTGYCNMPMVQLYITTAKTSWYGYVSNGAGLEILDLNASSDLYYVRVTTHTLNNPDLYNERGYILKARVTITSGGGAIGGGKQVGSWTTTSGSYVYLRSGPGTHYGILGQTGPVGEQVYISAASSPVNGYIWYQVYHSPSAVTGWMRGDYLN